MWFQTLQIAFRPQVFGHGSTHLLRIHVLVVGQSVLTIHSGLQPLYGSPLYSGIQVQVPALHTAFTPQGEGLHGSATTSNSKKKKDM